LLLAASASMAADQATSACPLRAEQGPRAIVELYTSEGCNSCPPADQWLAALPHDGSVLALAFHVDYWDSLGWADRFASPAFTARQRALQSPSGARFVYTPQVLVDGRDFPGWRQLPPAALPAAASPPLPPDAPRLLLRRESTQLIVEVGPAAGGASLAGYWALVEDGHGSQVAAGENAGRALRHDHVVRRYTPLAAWRADSSRQWTWSLPSGAPGHTTRAVFVLTDASGSRPLAARQLGVGGCQPGAGPAR